MKEQQKHRDAFEYYFLLRQDGATVVDAVRLVADKSNVSEGAIYTWKREFDWNGREAIRTHDVQTKIIEKTNEALADNKAWYLRITHNAIKQAEDNNIVQIENARDYDLLVKQALTIQGDDNSDRAETNELLRGLLNAITEDPGAVVARGVKRSFNDKSQS